MGKVKKVTMDESQESVVLEKAKSKKKSMTRWEELYADLAPHTAQALRTARIKPEQLSAMADGELTAVEGINDNSLEEIRSKYPADLSAEALAKMDDSSTEEGVQTGAAAVEVAGSMPANKRHLFKNGKAISTARSQVDRTKLYPITEAVKLVKKTNITKFSATVTLHINLEGKDAPTRVEVTFPYVAGAAKRVAIVSDELLADIDKGKIEFDILVTHPSFMPKLAKYAKLLGPKGLMPTPKAGTVTPNPEAKAKEFAGGKSVVKAEPKFPIIHVTVGKVGQAEEELVANIKAVLDAVKARNMSKATLASTMSPGIKLQLS